MQTVRVNVAVLSIANSGGNVAIENIVADRLTDAGHQIAAFEAVRDTETAIRAQLVGWLADPDIDVVVVVGDGEHTSTALKPMVDQALPGFADLLRMLAFQEIGASAMLSAAEAARCGTTFVFVLPGNENAVKAAMEKLILPQLDPKTKPRNLIGSMPRLRDAVEHDVTKVDVAKLGEISPTDVTRTDHVKTESARVDSAKVDVTTTSVPTPIPVEKTATGAGVQPKLPAGRAEPVAVDGQRPRSRTGVNVIVRKVEDPTKPIELQKLEQQLALSKDDEPTKAATPSETQPPATQPPATQPSATQPSATQPPATTARPNIATRPLDVGNLRAPATPNANAKPLPSITAKAKPAIVDDHTKVDHHTNPDRLKIGDATKPLELTKPSEPKPRASRPKVSDVGDATKPLDLGKLPKLPPGANKDEVDSHDTNEIIALAPKSAPKATPPVATPTTPPPRVRQPTPPIPTSVVMPKKKVVEEVVETLDLEPDAESPPVVETKAAPAEATEAPVDDDPEVASSALLAPPQPTRRKPTAPPPTINDLITTTPSSSLDELPRGAFVYPTTKPSRWPLILGLLVLSAAIGGGAMWFFNRDKAKPEATAVAPPTVEPGVEPGGEIDAAAPVVGVDAAVIAAVEVDAAESEIEIAPPDAAEVAATNPKPTNPRPTNPRPTNPRPTNPRPTEKPAPIEKPVEAEKPAPAGPVAEPGCEEVACVMEKYARPCCARFKPKGEAFVPSAGNGDDLSKPQIRAGVDKMKPRVIACGEQHQTKGTVKLSISVNAEGSVTDLSVVTAPDDALGECVASALRKARFAQTKNGGSFTYPFVF